MGHIEAASMEKARHLGGDACGERRGGSRHRRAPTARGSADWQPTARRSTRASEDRIYRCRRRHATRSPLFRSPHPSRRRAFGRRGREGASAGSFVRVRSRVTALWRRDSRPARPGICRPRLPASETDRSVDPARSQLSLQRSAAGRSGALASRCRYSVSFHVESVGPARARRQFGWMDACHGPARGVGSRRS